MTSHKALRGLRYPYASGRLDQVRQADMAKLTWATNVRIHIYLHQACSERNRCSKAVLHYLHQWNVHTTLLTFEEMIALPKCVQQYTACAARSKCLTIFHCQTGKQASHWHAKGAMGFYGATSSLACSSFCFTNCP